MGVCNILSEREITVGLRDAKADRRHAEMAAQNPDPSAAYRPINFWRKVEGTDLSAVVSPGGGHVIFTGPCGLRHRMTREQAQALAEWIRKNVR